MQEGTSFKVTSTPLELSERDISENNDSGYHSNVSCINLSRSSSVTLRKTRSLSRSLTPDNFLHVEPIKESGEPINYQNGSSCHHISPSFLGEEYVDFFFFLGEKGSYSPIIRKILGYLRNEDLFNAAAVSKIWKSIIMSLPSERRRLRHYVREFESTKENRTTANQDYEFREDRISESPRNTLMQIQNIQREFALFNSPVKSTSPPVVSNDFRFEAYQKEGCKVKIGRRLFSCPKCKLPSHADPVTPNAAECTNSICRYRFCILCLCEEHKTKMCDFISTPLVRKQSGSIGTIRSKKNLKRLLL